MAFRSIDEIPKPPVWQAKTIRQRIRDDIAEAEKQGVYKFEFVGNYNFKTLATTAREEAERLERQAICELREQKVRENHENDDVYYSQYDKTLPKKYNISSIKGEKEGTRRVFCEIIPENLENGWQIALKRHIAQCIANHPPQKEIDAKKAKRPKLKLDYYEGDADGIS